MMLTAICITWLLTCSCANDVLLWLPVEYETHVTWDGITHVYPPFVGMAPIGCWEGTIRIQHVDFMVAESEPRFFYWAADPGRFMQVDCSAGDCEQYVCEENGGTP